MERSEKAMNAAAAAPSGALWVVTDGRPGNENPALGLAERLAGRMGGGASIEILRLRLEPWATALPAPVWPLLGVSAAGWPFSGLAEGGALGRRATDPDARPLMAIGAGRRAAPVVAALGKLSAGAIRTVQLLDPKLGPERFDLTIAPRHDGPGGPRRLATVGSLHRIDPETPPAEDPRLPAGGKRVAFLIGGKSKSASFGEEEAAALLCAIETLAAQGAAIAATASRRTPADAAARIAEAVRVAGGFFWDGSGENPYRATLFWADALIVTADSVNMASEACALGKPVYIAPATRRARKFEAFHAALFAGGHARPLEAGVDLDADWRPTPLDDMTAATEAALALLARSSAAHTPAPSPGGKGGR